MTDTPDPNLSTPGLPRPVVVGTAHYRDDDGIPRAVPIYEPGPATNGQRVQLEDLGEGWTFEREEPLTTPSRTAEERLAGAASALASLDTLEAPVLPVDVLDVLTDLRTAIED